MSTNCKRQLIALAVAAALTDCTVVATPSDGADPVDDNAGSSPAANTPTPDASQGTSMQPAMLGFTASNVPAATPLVTSGDWVFSTQTCGASTVQIDTTKGIVNGCDPTMQFFSYAAITQSDMSLGSLPAALFVTGKFTIQPGMTVTVVGNLPLIVLALDDVNIGGLLNGSRGVAGGGIASSAFTKGNGPGGGGPAMAGAGAGGGGGFCGLGGAGGGNGGMGGTSYGNASDVPLLGGSAGGGAGQNSGTGGGAVQIVSATSLQVTGLGVIQVGGGGGTWGGSGAGSGGAILLEAPMISIAGTLAANGGGGGGGNTLCNTGQDGQPSATPAAGDTCPTNPGGAGAAGSTINGAAPASGMFGGGGGAAGRIRLNTMSGAATIGPSAVISPAPATTCTTQGMIAP
jgi:hypothetical protein